MASRLADSASPYLRAHAGNPVAWFAWGEEAFAEARHRGVPVLVSIGYSTCHWCHVMARESFEDAATAAELNAGFVAVKVDREERPEVDEAYLAAASAFTRDLGWPLTVFTTPDGRAFFAGTYFPSRPRQGVPSFRQVLTAVSDAWAARRGEVEGTAAAVTDALAAVARGHDAAADPPDRDALAAAARRVVAREDPRFGGFAAVDATPETPKFPTVPALRFLQAPALTAVVPEAAATAARAVAAMAASPLRDAVDGGFFRYATRRDWTVPHYERMLTDNAGLVEVALDAGMPDVARGAAGFLRDVLQQPGGGFAAAQDSESWIDGVRSEGGYYARNAAGRAVLDPPAVDGKVVTGWNGLAIAVLARAGSRLGDAGMVESARWAADAVLESNRSPDGRWLRASLDEIASPAPATAEDHGMLAEGLAALAAATGETAYAVSAREVLEQGMRAPGAPGARGWDDPVLRDLGIPRPADASDTDRPSGPSAIAAASLALWLLGAGEGCRELAASLVRHNAVAALSEPMAHGAMLRVAASLAMPPRQIVVVTDDPEAPLAEAVRALLASRVLAADVFAVVSPRQAADLAAAGFALFDGKGLRDGRPALYDCRAFACRLPVTDPAEIARA